MIVWRNYLVYQELNYNTRKRRIIVISFKNYQVLVIFILLTFLLTPSLLLAQDSNEIPFDKLNTPTELRDIIDTFKTLKYGSKSFKKEEKVQDLLVEFQYQGKEEVDGEQADEISIVSTIETESSEPAPSQMNIWLNDDGKIVKMIQNEQEIPPAMAESMKDKMLQAVFFPFYHFEELDLKEIASTGEVTRSQKMIGEKEVDIIKVESDDVAEYGLKSGTVNLAEFEKFIMMVSFDYIVLEEAVEEEKETHFDEVHFEVKEIKLR